MIEKAELEKKADDTAKKDNLITLDGRYFCGTREGDQGPRWRKSRSSERPAVFANILVVLENGLPL